MNYQLNNIEKTTLRNCFVESKFDLVEQHAENFIEKGCQDLDLYNLLAVTYAKQNKFLLAEKYFLRLIHFKPDDVDYNYNLANLYLQNKQLEKSIIFLHKSLNIDPDNTKSLVLIAKTYTELEDYDNALKFINKINPNNLNDKDVLIAKGILLNKTGLFKQSLDCFKLIAKRYGYDSDLYGNMSVCNLYLGNLKKAKKYNDLADYSANSGFNNSLMNLKLGKWREGWSDYDFGILNNQRTLRNGYEMLNHLPMWDPDLHKNAVIVVGEQGLGDELMHATMLGDVLKEVNNVYLLCDVRLKNIIKNRYGRIKFIKPNEKLTRQKFQSKIPMGSLSKFFRNSEKDFPRLTKHNSLNNRNFNIKHRKLNKKLIGLSWNTTNRQFGPERNIGLCLFSSLFNNPNLNFINLQYGDHSKEINKVENNLGKKIFSESECDNKNDIDGLAQQMLNCDLVISIDNSTVHLAGFLNVKTYILLPYVCDYRWQEERKDTPWYPNSLIFRQTKRFDWKKVIKQIETILH